MKNLKLAFLFGLFVLGSCPSMEAQMKLSPKLQDGPEPPPTNAPIDSALLALGLMGAALVYGVHASAKNRATQKSST